jgi:hypothetical protein
MMPSDLQQVPPTVAVAGTTITVSPEVFARLTEFKRFIDSISSNPQAMELGAVMKRVEAMVKEIAERDRDIIEKLQTLVPGPSLYGLMFPTA